MSTPMEMRMEEVLYLLRMRRLMARSVADLSVEEMRGISSAMADDGTVRLTFKPMTKGEACKVK